ncbi:acetyl-CoA decarbonylase/synthase complex subunit gamma, partial [Candidatus Hydrogenedentota bacterium]
KDLSLPLCLQGSAFEDIEGLTEKAREAGLKELVMAPSPANARDGLAFLTQSRRAAIAKKHRPMGFPTAIYTTGDDSAQVVIDASWYVVKYAGVVAVDLIEPEEILAILTSRQDIYTDPQKPVQVEPGLHTVGEPGKDSPVLVTTNFALSYYSVEGEVTSSRIPTYILAVDTEGTSVLTAWAADKFNETTIAQALTESGVESQVGHHKIVLPGHVAVLTAPVKEESGWEVQVGPKESSGIVSFLKNDWKP